MTQLPSDQDVAHFLTRSPDFFLRHGEVLEHLQFQSSLGERTISLQERQIDLLREKIRIAEMRHAELLTHARLNLENIQRMTDWTASMLRARHAELRPDLITDRLKAIFGVEHVTFRIWEPHPSFGATTPEAWYRRDATAEICKQASGLTQPYCGILNDAAALSWLPNPSAIRSIALIPLRSAEDAVFGLLLLAANEPERFSVTMATDFLRQIGRLASAALEPLLMAPLAAQAG